VHAIHLVDFLYRVSDARVVLALVLVVELEVDSRADQVERVRQGAADHVGRETGERRDPDQLGCAVLLILVEVQAEEHCVVSLEEVVNGVEDARKGDIANQRDFEPGEEAARALFGKYLSDCVLGVGVLGEAHHFKAGLDHDQRI
jgi:hypothetical protein